MIAILCHNAKRLNNLERTHTSLELSLPQISLWMHIFLITLNAAQAPAADLCPRKHFLCFPARGKTHFLLSCILRLAGEKGLINGRTDACPEAKQVGNCDWQLPFELHGQTDTVERGVWEGGTIVKMRGCSSETRDVPAR